MVIRESVDGLRIGDIAAATGLTVRTLHHYDEVGLVTPTRRTDAGHRLYGPEALERLYRVSMLRSLGLSLTQIRVSLDGDPAELREVLVEHMDLVDGRVSEQQRLRRRLAALLERSGSDDDPSTDLLAILEDMMKLQPALERRVSILVYADLEAAYDHLVRVFALGAGELTRDQGSVVHGVVHAGDGEIWLHGESKPFGLASPQNLGAATATMAVLVDDVDDHHRHAVAEGAVIRYPPVDQPYGFREYGAIDPEGHLWSFMRAHR